MRNDTKIYVWQYNKDRRERVIDGIVVKNYDRRQKNDGK